jgi:hypothetical protein
MYFPLSRLTEHCLPDPAVALTGGTTLRLPTLFYFTRLTEHDQRFSVHWF